MAEEKEKSQVMAGVMTGIVYDATGQKFIAIDVMGSRIALSIGVAGVVFNQIGDLLDHLGYFDDIEDVEDEPVEVKKCNIH